MPPPLFRRLPRGAADAALCRYALRKHADAAATRQQRHDAIRYAAAAATLRYAADDTLILIRQPLYAADVGCRKCRFFALRLRFTPSFNITLAAPPLLMMPFFVIYAPHTLLRATPCAMLLY